MRADADSPFTLQSFTSWMIKSAANCVHAAPKRWPYRVTLSVFRWCHVERRWLTTVTRRPHIKHSEDDACVIPVALFACGHRQATTR